MPVKRVLLPDYCRRNSGEWVVVRENNRSARFRNADSGRLHVLVVQVDGGLITDGERADYIISHPEVVDVIVELKGSDVAKAVRQIRATVPVWRQHLLSGQMQAALVVRGAGMHPKVSLNIERWQKEFRKNLRMKLLVETRNREYEFSEFLSTGNPNA
jgi:hypothetical protein